MLVYLAFCKIMDLDGRYLSADPYVRALGLECDDMSYLLCILIGIVFFVHRIIQKKQYTGNHLLFNIWLVVLTVMPILEFVGSTLYEVAFTEARMETMMQNDKDSYLACVSLMTVLYFSPVICIAFAGFFTGALLRDVPIIVLAVLFVSVFLFCVAFVIEHIVMDMILAGGVLILGLYCYPLGRLVNKDE